MNELQDTEIKQLELEIKFYKNQTVQSVFEVGERLIRAKSIVPHGEWENWLNEKVDFSQERARQIMIVTKEYSNSKMSWNISFDKMFMLTSLKSEERETFIEENPVEDMTTRELRQAIKEKKELERRVEELKNQKPTVIEKEKIIEVVPGDYEEIKTKLKNTVDKSNFEKLRKEFEEKIDENFNLKKQIEQLAKTDSKEQHREKLKDNTLIFCNRVHTFLNDVGGLAWLTEYIEELDDYDKRSYYKALDLLEGWVLTVKSNINKGEV